MASMASTRYAVDVAVRDSTRLAREPRQFATASRRNGRRKTDLVVNQHVARLAVPVDDAVRVQERKRDDQFRERRHTAVQRHLPPLQQRLQGPARKVVRDQVERILRLESISQIDDERSAL